MACWFCLDCKSFQLSAAWRNVLCTVPNILLAICSARSHWLFWLPSLLQLYFHFLFKFTWNCAQIPNFTLFLTIFIVNKEELLLYKSTDEELTICRQSDRRVWTRFGPWIWLFVNLSTLGALVLLRLCWFSRFWEPPTPGLPGGSWQTQTLSCKTHWECCFIRGITSSSAAWSLCSNRHSSPPAELPGAFQKILHLKWVCHMLPHSHQRALKNSLLWEMFLSDHQRVNFSAMLIGSEMLH